MMVVSYEGKDGAAHGHGMMRAAWTTAVMMMMMMAIVVMNDDGEHDVDRDKDFVDGAPVMALWTMLRMATSQFDSCGEAADHQHHSTSS